MPSQDVKELAARVLLQPGFIDLPMDEALEALPYGDLTPDEETAVRVCWDTPQLRAPLEEYWKVYQAKRESGSIPAVREPWFD